ARHHDAEQLLLLQGGEGFGREAGPGVDIAGLSRGRLDTHRACRGEPVAHAASSLTPISASASAMASMLAKVRRRNSRSGSSTSNASSSDSIRLTVAWELSPAA